MALPIVAFAARALAGAASRAGLNFGAQVTGTVETAARIEQLSKKLGDLRTPNRAVALQLYQFTIRNFDQDGNLQGGWLPLAPSTVKEKAKIGKEKMLVRTGQLRNSLISFSDAENAGIGSALTYAKFHQEGADNLPRREILPRREAVDDIGMRVYEFYVAQQTRAAGGTSA